MERMREGGETGGTGGERQSGTAAGGDIQGVALTRSHPSSLLTTPPRSPIGASPASLLLLSARLTTAHGVRRLPFEPDADDGFKWRVAPCVKTRP